MEPRNILKTGAEILGDYLYPLGFHFEIINEGKGSGGEYAHAEFIKGDQKIELHFRHSLGLVRYHYQSESVSHENYMNSLGVIKQCQYPGFSSDPLDGFRHLKHDLMHFCTDFFNGNCLEMLSASKIEQVQNEKESIRWRSVSEGDDIKKEKAKIFFDKKQYQECVEQLEKIHYPDLLTKSEHKMFELAKKRIKSV